jgi:hypothetical protein
MHNVFMKYSTLRSMALTELCDGSLQVSLSSYSGLIIVQVQDAILASKRRVAPHIVAPIRRFATSKLASQYLDTLLREQASAEPAAAPVGSAATASATAAAGAGASAAAGTTASNGSSSSSATSSTCNSSSSSAGVGSALAAGIIRMPEFLVPNDVISAVITQVGEETLCAVVLHLGWGLHV